MEKYALGDKGDVTMDGLTFVYFAALDGVAMMRNGEDGIDILHVYPMSFHDWLSDDERSRFLDGLSAALHALVKYEKPCVEVGNGD